MERFSYKGGCGIRECTHIKALKRRAGLGTVLNTAAAEFLALVIHTTRSNDRNQNNKNKPDLF